MSETVNHRLMRSSNDRLLGGVAGGIATYLAVDVVLVRLAFVLLVLTIVPMVLLYLLLWIIMPKAPKNDPLGVSSELYWDEDEESTPLAERHRHRNSMIGIGLIVVGSYLTIQSMLPVLAPFLLPLLLISGGVILLVRNREP